MNRLNPATLNRRTSMGVQFLDGFPISSSEKKQVVQKKKIQMFFGVDTKTVCFEDFDSSAVFPARTIRCVTVLIWQHTSILVIDVQKPLSNDFEFHFWCVRSHPVRLSQLSLSALPLSLHLVSSLLHPFTSRHQDRYRRSRNSRRPMDSPFLRKNPFLGRSPTQLEISSPGLILS